MVYLLLLLLISSYPLSCLSKSLPRQLIPAAAATPFSFSFCLVSPAASVGPLLPFLFPFLRLLVSLVYFFFLFLFPVSLSLPAAVITPLFFFSASPGLCLTCYCWYCFSFFLLLFLSLFTWSTTVSSSSCFSSLLSISYFLQYFCFVGFRINFWMIDFFFVFFLFC